MKSKQCKIEGCNNPVWGNGLCANHKPRKRISAQPLTNYVKKEQPIREISEMRDFFLQLWKKRPHKSEVSGDYLGSEALSTYFHHILPKGKYPEAMFDEKNIILLTWEEHDQVEMDPTRYDEVNKRRELLKQKYEIN
jgi:hypothetical protein